MAENFPQSGDEYTELYLYSYYLAIFIWHKIFICSDIYFSLILFRRLEENKFRNETAIPKKEYLIQSKVMISDDNCEQMKIGTLWRVIFGTYCIYLNKILPNYRLP